MRWGMVTFTQSPFRLDRRATAASQSAREVGGMDGGGSGKRGEFMRAPGQVSRM